MVGPYEVPDHPAVAACMRTGWPSGMEPREYVCPKCGAECETVYTDFLNRVAGCDRCLDAKDVYDYYEEMEE
jgi:hypothetical protein